MAVDEGPSPEDLDRFGGDTGYCPHCGAEVWDQSDRCAECKAWLREGTRARPPVEDFLRRRWLALVAIVVLIAFLMIVL